MTRFYFDIHDNETMRDDVGIDCVDLEDARQQVRRSLPDMARDVLAVDQTLHRMSIVVRDEGNKPVYRATLTFDEILAP